MAYVGVQQTTVAWLSSIIFSRAGVDGNPGLNARFDVQVRAAGSLLLSHVRRGRRAVLDGHGRIVERIRRCWPRVRRWAWGSSWPG